MSLLSVGTNAIRIVLTPVKPAFKKPFYGNSIFRVFSANISGKTYRTTSERPPPFPYKEKKYTLFRRIFDRTTDRFDENTKVIVIDGPIASGKTKLAKELAEELDMCHFPEANMDMLYINAYGYDMRQLDPQLPEAVQSFDEKKFCMDPKQLNAASYQIWMYQLRFSRYFDALTHILNTGQGVILERCPWSDMVFVEAMRKNNYMSKEAQEVYYRVKQHTIHELLRPHLVIYLDVSVDKTLENIKARNLHHEVNGKALTTKYLEDIEDSYKKGYLKEIGTHAELLIYDWTEPSEGEIVVEDIERIDFDCYTKHDLKLRDWLLAKEQAWGDIRMDYTNNKHLIMEKFNVPSLDAPELLANGEEVKAWYKAWYSAPGMEYEKGYNPVQGDTNLLFKTKKDNKNVSF